MFATRVKGSLGRILDPPEGSGDEGKIITGWQRLRGIDNREAFKENVHRGAAFPDTRSQKHRRWMRRCKSRKRIRGCCSLSSLAAVLRDVMMRDARGAAAAYLITLGGRIDEIGGPSEAQASGKPTTNGVVRA